MPRWDKQADIPHRATSPENSKGERIVRDRTQGILKFKLHVHKSGHVTKKFVSSLSFLTKQETEQERYWETATRPISKYTITISFGLIILKSVLKVS